MINSNTKIALTNLGKYNEGELVYKWLDLPFTEEELEETKEAIGIDGVMYEEWFISDWESDIDGLEIGEYEDIEALNETIEAYENLSEWEAETAAAAVEYFGRDINLETSGGFTSKGYIEEIN
jgi:hypothetical protein